MPRALELFFAAMTNSVEKRAGCQDDGACSDFLTALEANADCSVAFCNYGIYCALDQSKPGLILYNSSHPFGIHLFASVGAKRLNGRSFAGAYQAQVSQREVRCHGHLSA